MTRNPISLLFVIFLSFCIEEIIGAVVNITVEETSARVVYTGSVACILKLLYVSSLICFPSICEEWVKNEGDNFYHGGAHDQTQEESGKATFTFTGTAIYYYSSLWPFDVTTVLTLDGESEILNFTDPDATPINGLGPPSAMSQIRWSRVNLSNEEHTLEVSRGNFVLVDAFTYTTDATGGDNNGSNGSFQNTTIQESDPRIIYNGNWNENDADPLYSGGLHAFSQDLSASAIFMFNGVAIYYHSTLWPFQVTTVLRLDDEPSETLDLYDHTVPDNGGPPTVESIIRWSRSNLTNGPHTLSVFTGNYALLDAITYTQDLSTNSSATNGLPTSASSTATPTAIETPSSSSSNSAVIGGAVGGTLGGLAVIALVTFIFLRRHRREISTRELTPYSVSGSEPSTSQWIDSPSAGPSSVARPFPPGLPSGMSFELFGGPTDTVNQTLPSTFNSSGSKTTQTTKIGRGSAGIPGGWELPPSYHA